MILKFIDRDEEMGFLEEGFMRKGFEFFVVYGRRRVGKTELIKNFLKNRSHIYLLCDKSGTKRNVDRFKKKVAEYMDEPVIATDDIEEIFSHLIKKIKGKTVIVFDEFSYLVEKDPAITSLFQVICDEVLKNQDILLILCGSSISMMEKGVLSYKSPLYGRKTAHIRVAPIGFKHFDEFFPLNDIKKNVEFYSVLDGVPFYLEKFSDKKTTLENIRGEIWSKKGKLYEEVDFLLREELREPDVYKTILDAIASGKTKVVDISNKSKIMVQDIDKYLKVLIRLGIIKKEIPITETKSKKSIYFIDDNLFNFCFLFFEPYKSDLEIGETGNAENNFKINFSSYMGRKFEKFVKKEILAKTNIFSFEKIGGWWGHTRALSPESGVLERKTLEIDIVALNEKTKEILFGECKWKDKVDAEKTARELVEKAGHVEWPGKGQRKEHFAIFVKSFKNKISEFEGKKVYCFDLKDMEKILRR